MCIRTAYVRGGTGDTTGQNKYGARPERTHARARAARASTAYIYDALVMIRWYTGGGGSKRYI